MPNDFKKEWSATDFFRRLVPRNRLAQRKGFVFCEISGLEGLEEAVASMQNTKAFVCVAENAAGYTDLDNTPHTRRIRTVFLAMRHKLDDMQARQSCMDTMRELHRQFCSVLIREKTRLEENMQYLDPRINLQEVSRYLIPGTAVCMFEIAVNTYIDLQFRPDEWQDDDGSGSGDGTEQD